MATINGRSSSSMRSPVIGTQINPEVCLRKNAMASGVANSAAMMRSPSFSRSSSSTTTTISPRATAAIASSTLAKGTSPTLPAQQPFDVLGGHVGLEVDPVADGPPAQRRDLGGVGDDRHRQLV